MENRLFKGGIIATVVASTVAITSALLGLNDREVQPVARTYDRSRAYEVQATQELRYRVNDRRPKTLSNAMPIVRKSLRNHKGEDFVIKKWGTNRWSHPRNLDETMRIYRNRLHDSRVGAAWAVRALKDNFIIKTNKLDINPAKIINTQGTNAIDIVVGTVVWKFGNVPEWGICQCRTIQGSSSWSQHAYCNAVDWGGDVSRLNNVANYLLMLQRKHFIPVSQILWRGRDMISGHSVYDHYNHIHVSGSPLRSGRPACA